MEKTNRTGHRAKTATVMVLFLAAAVLSAVFMGKVAINYNLADYLGDGTETKMALDIIEEEFGMTGNMQVMVKNVSAETAEEMCERIEDIPNVLNVNFDKYDETYYKDGNALFVVVIDGDDYSEAAAQVAEDIREAFALREGVEYGGMAVEKQALREAITGEMGYILAVSLCLVVAILLITSESWLEPFVLLAASGVAVLINRGTNFFFGEISYITNSIAAILQLALSIDYSIVLLHSYRREKEKTPDRYDAMRVAVRSVIKPMSASALTTMAGLLALLFMSFRIGFDIGLVLMKGIVISAITSLTLLPALVLLFDKPMKRAGKRAFVPGGRCFCKVAFRADKGIVPAALALVIVCGVLQSGNRFVFSDTKAGNTAISDVFGNNNSVVVVYKNTENNDEKDAAPARMLEEYCRADGSAVLTGYTAYSNTVREAYDVGKAVQKLELSEEDARMLFAMYHLYSAPSRVQMTLAEFVRYADALVGTDADAKEFADKDTMDDNTLLVQKMRAENREKVTKAQKDREKAQNLLLSRTHARMLLSVNLPNESEETTDFVERLSAEVKEIFGEDACIAGEIVSTYDMEKTFNHDNLFITVFTLISIFVIVMLIFRSLSLPMILVAVIQGAIFIAMGAQLLGNGTFFMSYIVSTCILMGATIDYGILMSSNYVAHRNRYDKKEALAYSVEAAMPTVFTSGLILTVCGFVIHFISSQNSISTVGLLIGIGTICSVLMITVVLPSLLYLLDGFVLRLSIRKK